jgi:hypothetical protein
MRESPDKTVETFQSPVRRDIAIMLVCPDCHKEHYVSFEHLSEHRPPPMSRHLS